LNCSPIMNNSQFPLSSSKNPSVLHFSGRLDKEYGFLGTQERTLQEGGREGATARGSRPSRQVRFQQSLPTTGMSLQIIAMPIAHANRIIRVYGTTEPLLQATSLSFHPRQDLSNFIATPSDLHQSPNPPPKQLVLRL